jgi:hypothetical protein
MRVQIKLPAVLGQPSSTSPAAHILMVRLICQPDALEQQQQPAEGHIKTLLGALHLAKYHSVRGSCAVGPAPQPLQYL